MLDNKEWSCHGSVLASLAQKVWLGQWHSLTGMGHYFLAHMWHFIRFYIICQDKNDLQRKKYNFCLKIITCDPLIYAMDQPKCIVLNQKEESKSA